MDIHEDTKLWAADKKGYWCAAKVTKIHEIASGLEVRQDDKHARSHPNILHPIAH